MPELIEYITQYITLEPRDVICDWHCSGVGFRAPFYLKQRDEVEVFIEGIGSLENHLGV